MKQLYWIFVIVIVLQSCKTEDVEVLNSLLTMDSATYISIDTLNPDFQAIFDQSTGIYGIRLDSNITDGAPTPDIYLITYVLSIPQGQVIERVNDTINLRIGANAIYPTGIDQALQLAKAGESWKFIIPSSLAYVNYSGDNLIPFQTSLEFDVNIIEVIDENEVNAREFEFLESYVNDTLNFLSTNKPQRVAVDGFTDFYKLIFTEGDTLIPSVGNTVRFSYEGKSLPDSIIFDAGEIEMTFEGGNVISGLFNAIGTMKRRERALVLMPSSAGYSESARIFPNIVDDGNAYLDLQQFLLDRNDQIIPTYASKVTPYEILTFEISLSSID
ncbi:MAG: FKBP-type peptidyl-prolyl cis-trans isomerase [Cyclobacteriaceae bacterium]